MCTRFRRQTSHYDIATRFKALPPEVDLTPQVNIAPEDPALIIPQASPRKLEAARFGISFSWVSDHIKNIRAESFTQKTGFRKLLQGQRCLIPADGFYEWKKSTKQPFDFYLAGPFGFAGIFQENGFAIITTAANALVAQVHDRMPVILRPEEEALWLDPAVSDVARLASLLSPYNAREMQMTELATTINSAKNKFTDARRVQTQGMLFSELGDE